MSEGIGGMDLRVPIGGLFVALGVVLAGFGLMTASDAEMYAKSGGLNINLWWGAAMLVTGALFLFFARRDAARAKG
ncbi:MAG: hypothetical protein IPJ78_07845 [Gemmatimonadetes bacterium]|nr:hypothetical protein [Gemmatimonadota bacterium]MBP7551458.1 hypothetical protein [Gemmatimonadaceae bacterium]